MKQLMLDFINRWKWMLGGAMGVYLLYCAVLVLEAKTRFFMWVVPVVGPILVSFDLQRGSAKVQSLLPVPRKKLGDSSWFQAVLLPTVMVFAAILIVSIAIGPFKPSAFGGLAFLFHTTVLSFAFSGTLYFALTLMPIGPQHGLWRNLLGAVTGGAYGLLIGCGGYLLFDESIQQWSTMVLFERILLTLGVILGIISLFTSRLLVRYRSTFRPGSAPVRESTPARWIVFPNRTAGLLEPWLFTIVFSLLAFLIPAGLVLSLLTLTHGGDIREVVAMILDSPGRLWVYGLPLLIVFAFIAGIRSIWSLRMIRTLPLTGWTLTGIVVSFPMLVWYTAWLATFVFLLVTGRLDVLVGLTRLMLLITGLVILTIGFLVRFGPRLILVAMAVMFPLMLLTAVTLPGASLLGGVSILDSPAAIIGLLFSALGIWITHRAITARSQSYRPSNFMGPGGTGR